MSNTRSGCPINLALEMLGDRWSLIVLRDIMFGDRRHFRVLLAESEEGIASNILADRLKRLVKSGLLSKNGDPTHKQKAIYSLTEKSIQLVPLFAHMGAWGRRHLPVTHELSIRAKLLEAGGPELWERFMEELRFLHCGAPCPAAPSVRARLKPPMRKLSGLRKHIELLRKRPAGRRKGARLDFNTCDHPVVPCAGPAELIVHEGTRRMDMWLSSPPLRSARMCSPVRPRQCGW